MRRISHIIVAVLAIITAYSFIHEVWCGRETKLTDCPIHHDTEFGGAYIDISIEDFNAIGFNFGDSVDLDFLAGTNKVDFADIGYFSGYYVPAGQTLLVGYKGYPNIKFCINYGDDIYANNGFTDKTTCTISLHEKGKYANVESVMSISYPDDRAKYESDEQFANFRAISVGGVKSNMLYRGASPVDDSRKRSAIVDSLLQKNGIVHVIDLADKEDAVKAGGKYEIHDTFRKLMDAGGVDFLGMGAAYKSDDFSAKMKVLMLSILEHDGPHYIHCLEGKDRTGFVCMVLETLCGATHSEMIDDYFITYSNYYGIEKGSEKYEMIKKLHIDEMIGYVNSFEGGVNGYLLAVGLTQEQISKIRDRIYSTK